MSAEKDKMEQGKEALEEKAAQELSQTTVEEQQERKVIESEEKPFLRSSHHSLNELLQVALDMGDQRVIDAIKNMKKVKK